MGQANGHRKGSEVVDYRKHIDSLSPEGRAYLIEQLGLNTSIEQLVACYSATADSSGIQKEIKHGIESKLPAHLHPTHYVQLDSLPKLSNGKTDRERLHEAIQQELSKINSGNRKATVNPDLESAQLKILIDILESLLDFEGITPEDNFFELGGDSITAIRFVSRAREAGVNIKVASVAMQPDIQSLLNDLESQSTPQSVESPFGAAPLTPIQNWFLTTPHPQHRHWNTAGRNKVAAGTNADTLCRSVQHCLSQHPEFAVQFHTENGVWRCHYPEVETTPALCEVISSSDPEAVQHFIKSCSDTFSLQDGWMIRFCILSDESNNAMELIWVAHHLIIDQLSAQTLIGEIESTHSNQQSKVKAESVASTSMRAWALACKQASEKITDTGSTDVHPESPAFTTQYCTEQDVSTIELSLDRQTTGKLQQFEKKGSLSTLAILVSALSRAWKQTFNLNLLPVDIEAHGRDLLDDQFDNSNLTGWFSSYYPVDIQLHADTQDDSIRHCDSVVQQLDRQTKTRHQFLLQEMSANLSSNRSGDNGRLLVNFMGSQSGTGKNTLFTPLPVSKENLRNKDNLRSHNIEINASFTNGQLITTWSIANSCMSNSQAGDLTSGFISELNKFASGPGHDRSRTDEFPDVDMSQSELDDFLDSLK